MMAYGDGGQQHLSPSRSEVAGQDGWVTPQGAVAPQWHPLHAPADRGCPHSRTTTPREVRPSLVPSEDAGIGGCGRVTASCTGWPSSQRVEARQSGSRRASVQSSAKGAGRLALARHARGGQVARSSRGPHITPRGGGCLETCAPVPQCSAPAPARSRSIVHELIRITRLSLRARLLHQADQLRSRACRRTSASRRRRVFRTVRSWTPAGAPMGRSSKIYRTGPERPRSRARAKALRRLAADQTSPIT